MPVSDLEMVMLRAHIDGEDEAAQRAFSQQLGASGDVSGLAALVHEAFVIVAQRQFTPQWTGADVIRYVARVRGLFSERPGLLDPVVAEDEIRRALGQPITAAHDAGTRALTWLVLLDALVASLDLDQQGTDDLLSDARYEADRLMAAAAS